MEEFLFKEIKIYIYIYILIFIELFQIYGYLKYDTKREI